MASDKLKAVNADEGEELQVDMSPMIDLVFLLLIFFIVVSNQVVVKQDSRVKPVVADRSKKVEDKHGRIVINILNNTGPNADDSQPGGVIWTDEAKKHLIDEAAVTEHVRKLKEQFKAKNFEPKLHLRASQEVEFKEVRKVVRAAAAGGVDQVIFASFPRKSN